MIQCLLRIEAFLGPKYSADFMGFARDNPPETSPETDLNAYDQSKHDRASRKTLIKKYLTHVFESPDVTLKQRAASIRVLYYCDDSEREENEGALEIKEALVKTICMDLSSVSAIYKAYALVALQAQEREFKHHLCQSVVEMKDKERSAWVREVLIFIHSGTSMSGSASTQIDAVAAEIVSNLSAEMERILNQRPGNNRLEIEYDSQKGVITLKTGLTLLGTVVMCPSREWCFRYSVAYNFSNERFYQCKLITTGELQSDLEYRMKSSTQIEFSDLLRHPTDSE